MSAQRPCTTEGCAGKHLAKGLCSRCYHRAAMAKRRAADPAAEAAKLAAWKAANRDAVRSQKAASYERNKEAQVARGRAYRERHPGRVRDSGRASSAKRQRENPETVRDSCRRSKRTNRDRVIAENNARRTAKTMAGGRYTAAEWAELKARYGHACPACGATDRKLTADHILPVAMGGTSWIANIQPLCRSCNSRKGKRHVVYRPWAERAEPPTPESAEG